MNKLFFYILIFLTFGSKSEEIKEYTAENIGTVLIKNIENDLLDPIILLNSNDKLKLSFDEFSDKLNNYTYTFIHCSANWEKSDLLPTEYLEGFTENYLNEYSFSFNTIHNYVHYECTFPNEDVSFILSGNYMLIVYNDETQEVVLKKKFIVYEKIIQIEANVKRATFLKDFISKQEIDFQISHTNFEIKNPREEIKVIIQQNDNWQTIKSDIKPTFIKNHSIEYDYDGKISFNGGNEFRNFDISSLRFFSQNIDTIYIKKTIPLNSKKIFTNLKQDEIRPSSTYFEKYDLNGKMIIKKDNSHAPENEGEYVWVKFNLNPENIPKNEKIYLFGELTNWEINSKYLLNYNSHTKICSTEILLKQGYYNYQYITIDKENNLSTDLIEGNYFETNNEYTIYVYYSSPWERYERLIGLEKITSNSLN